MINSKPPNQSLSLLGEAGFTTKILIMRNLQKFAMETFKYLEKLDSDKTFNHLGNCVKSWIQELYNLWMVYFLKNFRILKQIDAAPHDDDSRANNIFTTLSQAKFLLMYNQITNETKQLVQKNILKNNSYLISLTTQNKSIMRLNQSEIMDALLSINEQICIASFDDLQHIRKITHAIYTRNSILNCQSCSSKILDVPDMRVLIKDDDYNINNKYRMYCTFYFYEILKRIRYFDSFKQNFIMNNPFDVKSNGNFKTLLFESEICSFLGSENIGDHYVEACNEVYEFPGDTNWTSYLYPTQNLVVGQILQCLRPDHAKSYFAQDCLTLKSILAGVEAHDGQKGRCCRMFVINSLSSYLNAFLNIPDWKSCVVISNDKFSNPAVQTRMMQCRMPYIVEIVSRYWLYNCVRGKVNIWVIDNIYDCIAAWFYILKRDYNSKLLEYNLSVIIDKIFP